MFHGLCHLTDDQGNAKNKICPECDTPFKVWEKKMIFHRVIFLKKKSTSEIKTNPGSDRAEAPPDQPRPSSASTAGSPSAPTLTSNYISRCTTTLSSSHSFLSSMAQIFKNSQRQPFKPPAARISQNSQFRFAKIFGKYLFPQEAAPEGQII